ncbi:TPA: hypothetical protein ACGO3H_001163 [Streptococcus suis]
MNKKWYKDESRGELAGVIAGLYDYFDLYENYGWKLENVRFSGHYISYRDQPTLSNCLHHSGYTFTRQV